MWSMSLVSIPFGSIISRVKQGAKALYLVSIPFGSIIRVKQSDIHALKVEVSIPFGSIISFTKLSNC